ncbi:MAG: DUF86 domain-containing protein [Pseudoflavonifractor sp.]|nr:DUF86 domain-containing protein [Pseudoflavonifractor sp.]
MREAIRDRERLHHIDEAIERLITETSFNLEDIKEDSLEYFGIVKLIEIIGEAVYKLTDEFKSSHTKTPWRQIERMRHVQVHGYYTVGYDLIREVIQTDIPVLKSQITLYLSEMG